MPYQVYSAHSQPIRLADGEFHPTEPVVVDDLTDDMKAQAINLRVVETDKDGNPVVPPPAPQPVSGEDHQKALDKIERLTKQLDKQNETNKAELDKAKAEIERLKAELAEAKKAK